MEFPLSRSDDIPSLTPNKKATRMVETGVAKPHAKSVSPRPHRTRE